jgi:hypothetical protein
VVSFAADEAWDALLGIKTAEAGTTGVPVLPPLFYLRMKNSLSVPRRRRHFTF